MGGRIAYLIKSWRWRRTRWGWRGRRNWHPCPAGSWHCFLSVLICSFKSLIYLQMKQKFMRITLPLETLSTRREPGGLGMTPKIKHLISYFYCDTVQGLVNVFCKRPYNKYFRLCRPHTVSVAYYSLFYFDIF